MVWWIAPVYATVKRGYREVLRQLPDGVLSKPAPHESHFDSGRKVILYFKNGSRMEFYSADRPEGMLGEGVDFAVLDEAATMPANVWEQIVRPTLMDREGGSLLISTPRGRNWFYRAWKRGQHEDAHDPTQERWEWESWTFESWTNKYLPEGEVEEMAIDLPAVMYAQEVEAKFVASGSNVFVVPDEIVQPKHKPSGHVVIGVDLAKTTDFTVFYAANARTRQNVHYERFQDVTWPRQRRRLVKLVKQLMKEGASGVTLVIDSTGPGDPFCDDMEELGYDVVPINFTTYKDKMVRLLAKDMEDGKAFLLDERVHEFEDYLLGQSPSGKMTYNAPAGSNDDVVCAKMLQHWGIVMEGLPDATIIEGVQVARPDVVEEVDSEEEDEWMDEDYFIDDEVVDEIVHHEIEARTTLDMMNDPTVWN